MKKSVILVLFLSTMVYAQTGEWVAKINKEVVSGAEFQRIYNAQLDVMEIMSNYQINASAFKNNKERQRMFVDEYVSNQLLLKRIKNENKTKKFINERWVNEMSANFAAYIKDQLYLKSYIDKVVVPMTGKVTDKEIAAVYEQNKSKFDKQPELKNKTAIEIAELIRQRLKMQKASELLSKLKSKVRDEASININEKYFK